MATTKVFLSVIFSLSVGVKGISVGDKSAVAFASYDRGTSEWKVCTLVAMAWHVISLVEIDNPCFDVGVRKVHKRNTLNIGLTECKSFSV